MTHKVRITEPNSTIDGKEGPAIRGNGNQYYHGDEVTLPDAVAQLFLGAGWCECCEGLLKHCERVPGQRAPQEIEKAYSKANDK